MIDLSILNAGSIPAAAKPQSFPAGVFFRLIRPVPPCFWGQSIINCVGKSLHEQRSGQFSCQPAEYSEKPLSIYRTQCKRQFAKTVPCKK
jgi:hypothetical protein